MTLLPWILSTVWLVASPVNLEEQIRWEWCSDARWAVGTLQSKQPDLSFDQIKAVASSLLLDKVDPRFLQVEFVIATKRDTLEPPVPDYPSFEAWRRLARDAELQEYWQARLVGFGGSAVLEYRGLGGDIWREVLRGNKDPLVFRSPEWTAEIVYIRSRACLPSTAFVTTTAELTPEVGAGIVEAIRARLPVLTAYLRNDRWFIHEGLPLLYPFGPRNEVPVESEYRAGRELYCTVNAGSVSCRAALAVPSL